MLQLAQLPGESLAHRSVAVPQSAGGNAGNGIEVATAFVIPDPTTLAALEGEREAVVGAHHRIGRGHWRWLHHGSFRVVARRTSMTHAFSRRVLPR